MLRGASNQGQPTTEYSTLLYAVVHGHGWWRAGPPVELERGDVVLMPFGDNHLMTDTASGLTRPIAELTSVDQRGMGHLVVEGGGSHTSLICGTFEFDEAGAHPVFSVLPRIIPVAGRQRTNLPADRRCHPADRRRGGPTNPRV